MLRARMATSFGLEEIWTERLACPACKGKLRAEPRGSAERLVCEGCDSAYPIRDEIPSFVDLKKTDQAAEIALRDDEATAYEGLFLAWEGFLEVTPLVRDLAPRRSDWVLEVGAGTGRVVREYIRNVSGVMAIDFSIESLRHIRRSLRLLPDAQQKLVPVHADACALPIRDGAFDRVLSVGMLQHLPTETHRARAVGGMARAIRPGGRFVLQARHWSKAHAFYETRHDSKWARSVAQALIGNASGSIELKRTAHYADGTVLLYNTTGDELRSMAQEAGISVERVVGRIHALKGMQRLGAARPLIEKVLERSPLSLLAAQEVIAVGTRMG
ncbi:MAG: methyltransferase domain-containing protein [Polyangiaceae bacterium]|nr:methyltransferase domain-containing protein [Polyangiaceae bacterium]